MIPHIVKQEDHLDMCHYCRRDITTPWISEFHSETHYKTRTCECGKTKRIKVPFHGSGHDNWSGLEKRIRLN